MSPLARIKAILGGSAGNLVEWYDWFAYSSTSLYFAKHFFPHGDQTEQLLQAAGAFGAGFLVRPVGAWLMGLFADWSGRRTALALSVALMSVGSFAIAILPTYAEIGVFAPLLLVVARLVQGLSLGGEYGASATYMSEMAGKARRGFWSSFQFVTLIAGQLAALFVLMLLQQLISKPALEAWGWRIPFAVGGVLAVVVFWIRTGIAETRSFLSVKEAGAQRSTARLLFGAYPKESWMIFGLSAAGGLAFYAYTTYMQKFLVNTAGFGKDAATALTAAMLVVYMAVQPAVGWASDRFGRKNTMALGFGLCAVLTYPVFAALAGRPPAPAAFALMSLLVVCLSGYSAVNAPLKAELFPAHVRALGVALPYALANTLFGGTAEYAALWLKKVQLEPLFYVYVSAITAVAALIALRMRNTNLTSLIVED